MCNRGISWIGKGRTSRPRSRPGASTAGHSHHHTTHDTRWQDRVPCYYRYTRTRPAFPRLPTAGPPFAQNAQCSCTPLRKRARQPEQITAASWPEPGRGRRARAPCWSPQQSPRGSRGSCSSCLRTQAGRPQARLNSNRLLLETFAQ